MLSRVLATLPALLIGCSTADPSRVSGDLKGRLIDQPSIMQQVAVRFVPRRTGEAVDYAGSGIRGNARDERRRYGAERTTVPDRAADAYLERLTARLARAWPHGRPPVVPRVQLVANRSYGAAALTDGSIRLNLGTLVQAGTEDELAFVIGHEMGHLFLRHTGLREDEHDDLENLREVTTGLGALGAALSSARMGSGGQLSFGAESQNRASLAALGGTVLSEGLDTLVEPAWARRQEAEADVFGMDIMAAAGFDPRYAIVSLNALESSQGAAQARLKAVAEAVEGQLGTQLGRGDINGAWRAAMKGASTMLNSMGRELKGWMRERHPDPAERRRWLDDYRDRIHGDDPLRPDSAGELTQIRGSAVIRNARQALEEVEASQDALSRGDPRSAMERARSAMAAAPWLPAARLQLALAQLEAGQIRQARDELRRVTADNRAPLIAFLLLAHTEAKLGDPRAALAVLDTAGRRFDAVDELAPERIALHRAAGNQAMAQQEAERCSRSANPRLRSACRQAIDIRRASR
ncbi:M48 family metalloprotease [Roseicella sp. DB1501]|uniref:M48 family metalloprotease n=1 Tax=Roseicella sp. DB1501 TaxID=2730925 RepID=UPI001493208F|nr:M48 family metalloprotease [Roseicella sp. DB1501]NOG73799.1 M48 family metalloprotease [Roseicella sp. DB1501]